MSISTINNFNNISFGLIEYVNGSNNTLTPFFERHINLVGNFHNVSIFIGLLKKKLYRKILNFLAWMLRNTFFET